MAPLYSTLDIKKRWKDHHIAHLYRVLESLKVLKEADDARTTCWEGSDQTEEYQKRPSLPSQHKIWPCLMISPIVVRLVGIRRRRRKSVPLLCRQNDTPPSIVTQVVPSVLSIVFIPVSFLAKLSGDSWIPSAFRLARFLKWYCFQATASLLAAYYAKLWVHIRGFFLKKYQNIII